jgi:hypothetical protein
VQGADVVVKIEHIEHADVANDEKKIERGCHR